MKKKILGILIVIAILAVGIVQGIPALADTTNTLDHVVISPSIVNISEGGIQQFNARLMTARTTQYRT